MRSLSAGTTLQTGKSSVEPRYLLRWEFFAPAPFTLYLADQPLTVLGQEWAPFVVSYGSLDEALNTLDAGGAPSTAEIALANTAIGVPGTTKARLSDLMRTPTNLTGTYEFSGSRITVIDLFAGLTSGDEVILGVFYLREPDQIGIDTLRLKMSDASLLLEDKLAVRKVTVADFPLADLDAVGQDIRIPIGALKKIPGLPVVAGAQTTLPADITASSPANGGTLTLTDVSNFPTSGSLAWGPPGSETMTWTGKSGTTGLTGITRTNPTVHAKGDRVFQVLSEYVYVFGENRPPFVAKVAANCQVDGVAQLTGVTLTVNDIALLPGRSFVTARFAALPLLSRQFGVVDSLTVGDNIFFTTSATTTTTYTASGFFNTPGGFSNGATMPAAPGQILNVTFTVTIAITDSTSDADAWWSFNSTNGFPRTRFAANMATGTYTFSFGTGASYGNLSVWTQTGISIRLTACSAQVTTGTPLTKTGAAFRGGGISGSGADIVVGDVITIDCDGLKDDGAGSITGTPSALIEVPADVCKVLLLAGFAGVTAADLGTSWTLTRAQQTAAAYKWAVLLGATKFSDLRRKLGEQGRAVLSLEGGKWEYKWLASSPVAQVVLDWTRDVWDDQGSTPSRTDRGQVFNSLWVYSARDYTVSGGLKDIYTSALNVADLTQPGLTDRLDKDLELDLVRDAATAAALGAFWLTRWKRQRWAIDLVAYHNVLALDKVDYFAVANHPILTAHGDAALVFELRKKRYRIDDDILIQLAGVEAS